MSGQRYQSAIRWLALTASETLFLWMFISVASVEAMGNAAMTAGGSRQIAERILIFAADWRHGMAGNSPIFMPGFFVVAVAGWYWARDQSFIRLLCEALLALIVAVGLAYVAAPLGIALAATAFSRELNLWAPAPGVALPGEAILMGAYSAACWTVFVAASRRAFVSRSWRPLIVVPGFYVLLAFSRHFTGDRIVAQWVARLARADAIAIASLSAIPVLITIFVKTTTKRPKHLD